MRVFIYAEILNTLAELAVHVIFKKIYTIFFFFGGGGIAFLFQFYV